MGGFFRSFGNFDIKEGIISFYSGLEITGGTISGPIESPKASTGQTIINLIMNAFIKSINPVFEKEATNPKGSSLLSATDRSSPAAAVSH